MMNMDNKLKWKVLKLILLIISTKSSDSKYLANSTMSATTDASDDVAILDGSIDQKKLGVTHPFVVNYTEQQNIEEISHGYKTEQSNGSTNPNVNETEHLNVKETEHLNVKETEHLNVSVNPNVNETEHPNVNETEHPIVNETEHPSVNETQQPNVNGLKKQISMKRNEYDTYMNKSKCDNNPVEPLFINATDVLITYEDFKWLVLCMHKIIPTKVCMPPYNPISRKYEDYTIMGIITEIYLCVPLCLLGIIGNVLSFITLSHEKPNTSILILKSLAVIDSLYLLLVVVFEPYYIAYHDTDWLDKSSLDKVSHTFTKVATYAAPFINMAQMCSAWFMVLLTIDRYVAICHPFKAIIYCTLRRVRVGICIIIFISIIYNIPVFWEVSYTQVYHECLKLYMFTKGVVRGSVGQHILFRIIYGLAGNLIFRNLLPVLLVISFNCRLIQSLRIARSNHDKMTAKSDNDLENRDKNITITLVSISFVYLLCILPMLVLSMLDIHFKSVLTHKNDYIIDYYEDKGEIASWQVYLKFELVVRLLVRVNSAINFLVYCTVRKGFRGMLQSLFKKSIRRESSLQTFTSNVLDKSNQRF